MKLSFRFALVAIASLPAFALAQDKPGDAPAKTELPPIKDPVATVNGENITKADLDDALGKEVKAAGMKADDLTAEQKLEGYRQILDGLIMDKLITKAASGVKVPQAEIDAEIAKIKKQFPSEDEFKKQLESVGQSEKSLNEQVGKMMQQRQWFEGKIGKTAEVTDADAKKFYDENKAEFEAPEQVKASHILFMVKKDDAQDKVDKQLEKAKAAAARAKKGEDFTALAKELSEEPGAKESGGDLGFFAKDRMVPEFADASFGMKPGDISEPVRTQFGWHVIKVEDRKAAGTTPFEEVKDQLTAYLKADKQRKAAADVVKALRQDAKIENNLPVPDAGH